MTKSHETIQESKLKTEQLLYFRLAFAGVALALAAGVQWFGGGDVDIFATIRVLTTVVIYSAVSLLLVRAKPILGRRRMLVLNAVLIACDVVSLTFLVHFTRGVESDLYVLYLLPILLSSYTFGRRGINATALLVSFSYVIMLLVENKSFLPYLLWCEATIRFGVRLSALSMATHFR